MLLLASICFHIFTALKAEDVSSTESDLLSRILYGTKASIDNYPYFASLANCGAAIISDRWLVTAAHCVAYPGLTSGPVWVGGEQIRDSKRYTFDKIVIYPLYSTISLYRVPINDIALLRLGTPLVFGRTVKALLLPTEKYQFDTTYDFAGKGKDEKGNVSKFLMRVDIQALNATQCQTYVSFMDMMVINPYLDQIKRVTMCTKRTEDLPGLCYGDSGSPLVKNNTLVGLASYINNVQCRYARLAFFTDVSYFVSWIKTVTGIM